MARASRYSPQRTGQYFNYLERFIVRNRTNRLISLGPDTDWVLKPGQQIDLLKRCTREQISQSKRLSRLAKRGLISVRWVKPKGRIDRDLSFINDATAGLSSLPDHDHPLADHEHSCTDIVMDDPYCCFPPCDHEHPELADADHTHTGFAEEDHEHSCADIVMDDPYCCTFAIYVFRRGSYC